MNTADTLAVALTDALNAHSESRPRSLQQTIGPSDIGFCRRKATYKITNTPVSDDPKDGLRHWPADVGTAIHHLADEALRLAAHDLPGFPEFILGSDIGPVTATLPSGAQVTGTFDLCIPEWNMLADIKTVDGYGWVKGQDVSQNHDFQRHLYALGALQAGLLRDDETLTVANVYLDRSGKERHPLVKAAPYDPTTIHAADQWVQDVIYAVQHGPDTAAQDIPAERCPTLCEWSSLCRGGVLPDSHEPILITDPDSKRAMRMYLEAAAMEKEAKAMKATASSVLAGINGSDGEIQVRWTEVAASDGYAVGPRDAYLRINVRPVRR